MSRVSAMTIGLVLIFLGAELLMVKSFLLTPRATRFMAEHFGGNSATPGPTPIENQGSKGGIFANGSFKQLFGGTSTNRSNYPGQSWPYYRTQNTPYSGPGNSSGSLFTSGAQGTPSSGPLLLNSSRFGQKRVPTPKWLCWPTIFVGVVFFLHGVALKRS